MRSQVTLSLTLLVLCSGTVLAQGTPDWMTPAVETICDSETGAAFGLCNAYCEAMDCETDDPHASATACSKVRSKFQQLTGRDLPCEVSCPCADPEVAPLFALVLAGEVPLDECFTEFDTLLEGIALFIASSPIAAAGLVDLEPEPIWACVDVGGGVAGPLTPEQGRFCADLLEQAANDQGVTCTP